MENNKNVLIVNFNTQKLTDGCIRSLNKHTPGCNIFVFDNSDKEPFVNTFDNVTVFDNTKGQIIDFEKWFEKYPKRMKSTAKNNNWASAKHAYSIEKCMEVLDEPFLLLDSDVLVKKDVSPLFNEKVCYNGEVVTQKNKIERVFPHICFINTPMCRKNGIHYFDENYVHGLRVSVKGDGYDTGAALFLLTKNANLPHGDIKCDDYALHYKAGSWTVVADKTQRTKHVSVDEWLEINKDLWDENLEENLPVVSRKSTPESEIRHVPLEEKIKPVAKKKEMEVKYLKMAKTSDRKIGVLNR